MPSGQPAPADSQGGEAEPPHNIPCPNGCGPMERIDEGIYRCPKCSGEFLTETETEEGEPDEAWDARMAWYDEQRRTRSMAKRGSRSTNSRRKRRKPVRGFPPSLRGFEPW